MRAAILFVAACAAAVAVGHGILRLTASQRPPFPDPMPAAVEAERRVEHVYLIHTLTAAGTEGPWICEQANAGVHPLPRAHR